MRWRDYWKDKALFLIFVGCCMAVTCIFLRLTGYEKGNVILLLLFWTLLLLFWMCREYMERRKYFKKTAEILDKMDQRYLLGELMPPSWRLEDRIYQDMIRRSNKSVIEKIRKLEAEQQEYKEYIESWVHEIKTPITGISLLCENGRKEETGAPERFRQISMENAKLENYVDMVLYYARSEQVYKDYLIQSCHLQEMVYDVLERDRFLLIRNGIRAEVNCDEDVFTDKKWLGFIVNQIVLNSVKYKRDSSPCISFLAQKTTDHTCLIIEDNGMGMPEDVLQNLLTDTNKVSKHGSGVGVINVHSRIQLMFGEQYGLEIYSEPDEGTRVVIHIPAIPYTKENAEQLEMQKYIQGRDVDEKE